MEACTVATLTLSTSIKVDGLPAMAAAGEVEALVPVGCTMVMLVSK